MFHFFLHHPTTIAWAYFISNRYGFSGDVQNPEKGIPREFSVAMENDHFVRDFPEQTTRDKIVQENHKLISFITMENSS